MKLRIGEQHIDYKKKPSVEDVILRINDELTEGFYFSHFIADGIEVYDDQEDYLEKYLNEMKELEVIIKNEKQFMNDVLLSAEEYVHRAQPEIEVLIEDFQKEPTRDTWANFELLLGGAAWLNDMLELIKKSNEQPSNWQQFEQQATILQQEVKKLHEAVNQNYHKQIAGVIQQGLLPVCKELEVLISQAIDTDGERVNLS
ncbi:hypothetical protein [Sporosarcina sp. Te-1]|uniref:hypothetical protein n=1 Tax=Sporosarcina sp. Te-1 TaxID=2818390 RepID=UPI001A9EE307|nr:hypothetical protein [Sporosarcina sp. Te-1]QTD41186.1 hypothetical protein J3U78_21080 [Sporosarcina sp. Te-1]